VCVPSIPLVVHLWQLLEGVAALGRLQKFLLLPESEDVPAAAAEGASIVSMCCCLQYQLVPGHAGRAQSSSSLLRPELLCCRDVLQCARCAARGYLCKS
jgi:hypothetical protein